MGQYGGTTTVIKTLPVGTVFYVNNGAWRGEIIIRNGLKCVLIEGDSIENAFEIKDDRTLDITIEDECLHEKVYADYIYTSNPPKYPWICSECGETGTDQQLNRNDSSYDEILKKFHTK